MSIHVTKHPLIQHKLGLMRKDDISTRAFRQLASEVSMLLTYEATKDLTTERTQIQGWCGPVEVDQVKGKKVTIVPILRAGLGMLDGVMELIPSARISVVGLYRDEKTLQPVPYFEKLVVDIEHRTALIVDPMLATGGTFNATVDMVKAKVAGTSRVCSWLPHPKEWQQWNTRTPMWICTLQLWTITSTNTAISSRAWGMPVTNCLEPSRASR